jgi:hypothetical protein
VIAVALGGCTPTAPAGYVAAADPIRLGDCAAAEANLEFFSYPVGDFEKGGVTTTVAVNPDCSGSATTTSAPYTAAQYFYSYVDGTSAVYFEGTPACSKSIYQPAAVAASHCTSDPTNSKNNHIVHFSGGPFLGWGGGFGVAMAHLSQDAKLCTQLPLPDYCPPQRPNDPVSTYALDMSAWDGVSFWARRGEQSQALLRVLVGDKFTDDDISYATDLGNIGNPNPTPHFCERVRDCSCTYQHLTCDFYSDTDSSGNVNPLVVTGGGYYCGPPGEAPGPAIMSPGLYNNANANNTCNLTRCNDVYAAYPGNGPDPKFVGRPCTPYTFRNGAQSSYCWDPTSDPPPAQPDQLCGDFWTFPVHLTTDWQFFTVPFNTMYQQGWAKKAPYFDTHSVSVVRFTWDTGNIDYYIDDVRFYRAKK